MIYIYIYINIYITVNVFVWSQFMNYIPNSRLTHTNTQNTHIRGHYEEMHTINMDLYSLLGTH